MKNILGDMGMSDEKMDEGFDILADDLLKNIIDKDLIEEPL